MYVAVYVSADDIKPSLTIDLLDHDISLIDSKESKKAYGFKVSHPTLDSFSFATDSRVAVERWIELLSLAATGRHDIIAPYPPYFKADSSDELQIDSVNFDEVRWVFLLKKKVTWYKICHTGLQNAQGDMTDLKSFVFVSVYICHSVWRILYHVID